jgi:uncharacterized protein (DUF1499 family)
MGQVAEVRQTGAHVLSPCPQKPNCVSSVNTKKSRYVAPLQYSGGAKTARARLLKILGSLKGAQVMTSDENYIHAEFVSPVFKFVDDVEFVVEENTQTIQLKSASRVGSYDFGANRRRITKIRDLFEEGVKVDSFESTP